MHNCTLQVEIHLLYLNVGIASFAYMNVNFIFIFILWYQNSAARGEPVGVIPKKVIPKYKQNYVLTNKGKHVLHVQRLGGIACVAMFQFGCGVLMAIS